MFLLRALVDEQQVRLPVRGDVGQEGVADPAVWCDVHQEMLRLA